MAETSTIEWTDATWNPITGCSLVSEGCRHCYAARLAATRLQNHPSRKGLARLNAAGEAKFTGEVRLNEQWLDQPLRWRRPRRIFVCAHGDLFHEAVPDEWIDRVFAVMALAPRHTFQVLTKRPERMREYICRADDQWHNDAEHFADRLQTVMGWNPAHIDAIDDIQWPLPNVWLGTSVEDQATADARIPHLLATPAAVRFVSAEPLLGAVDLSAFIGVHHHPDNQLSDPKTSAALAALVSAVRRKIKEETGKHGVDWVIVGGESGPGARPMHPDWARSLRDQCQAAGVAFHFKQWGEYVGGDRQSGWVTYQNGAWTPDCDHDFGDGCAALRYGKARSGRLLDGRTWDKFPQ